MESYDSSLIVSYFSRIKSKCWLGLGECAPKSRQFPILSVLFEEVGVSEEEE